MSCASTDSTQADSVTVFAAASLVDAFTEIGDAFKTAFPDITVDFNFASSSELATQIAEGAPADVFASADEQAIDRVRNSGLAVGPTSVFATNSLQIMVEPGNPLGIDSLLDLENPDIAFITCDETVPIGRYSAQVLAAAGVIVTPVSYEENVKGIVSKILIGEADAGIVYTSDIVAAGSAAQGISIPSDLDVEVTYPIVALGDDPSGAAQAFVEFLTSSSIAREILDDFGFGQP